MGGTGVIDRFLAVFTQYIDSGFGLLNGEAAYLASTLIVIDVTLAALFWAWGADEVSMAERKCARWRRKSVPVRFREKGHKALLVA